MQMQINTRKGDPAEDRGASRWRAVVMVLLAALLAAHMWQ